MSNIAQAGEDFKLSLDLASIDNHFPMAEYRDGQRDCIEFGASALNDGKKVIILECPTGSGKSAIAMTLADMVDNSYYLTSTKQLQDQLVKDFGDQIVELKGRNAYPCTFYDRNGQEMVRNKLLTVEQLNKIKDEGRNCNNGYCKTKMNRAEFPAGSRCGKCFHVAGINGKLKGSLTHLPPNVQYSTCPYYEQVFEAINSRKVVMNFSSFVYQTQMTKDRFKRRRLLIIDEAHNTETQLMDFITLSISDQLLQGTGYFIPQFETAAEYALWFEEIKFEQLILQMIAEAEMKEDNKKLDDIKRVFTSYATFMSSMSSDVNTEWICEYNEIKDSKMRAAYRTVTLKPIYVQNFIHDILFKYADAVVMLSATILDVNLMCRSLGINRSHVAAYRMKNRFPKENRPIYLKTVAKMTGGKNNMHVWSQPLIDAVNELATKYAGKRGIIHTHNFAIQELLVRECDHDVAKRFLIQQQYQDKKEMLEVHARSSDTIIVAPAMHEGVDLHGDLSRFQIICKVPFPDFHSNKQLSRRMELDPRPYDTLVALKLVQSYGRSIRSESDHADTYILDESIHNFLKKTRDLLPEWFKEAIVN